MERGLAPVSPSLTTALAAAAPFADAPTPPPEAGPVALPRTRLPSSR